jgi:hypothetical protein
MTELEDLRTHESIFALTAQKSKARYEAAKGTLSEMTLLAVYEANVWALERCRADIAARTKR